MATEANLDAYTRTGLVNAHVSSPSFHVDPNNPTRIERAAGQFLYMDVGLWGGSGQSWEGGPSYERQRNFGIVYGNWAVLCDYVDSGGTGHVTTSMTEEVAPINDLFSVIGTAHVRVTKALRYQGASQRTNNPNTIYVFLPDCHIPMLTGLSVNRNPDGPINARWDYVGTLTGSGAAVDQFLEDGEGARTPMWPLPDHGRRVLGPNGVEWFSKYRRADIFQLAATELIALINGLEAFTGNGRPAVHLVQLGDMLDLWIGFEAVFEGTPDNAPDVILSPARPPLPSGTDFVNYWLARAQNPVVNTAGVIGNANAELIRRMANFSGQKTWLWGNHDCYLKRVTPTGIGAARQMTFADERMFSEHGHVIDSNNRDGVRGLTSGHSLTNHGPFDNPKARRMESWVSDPRGKGLDAAAFQWIRQRNDSNLNPFVIYVMGHSHLPGLGLVTMMDGESDQHLRDAQAALDAQTAAAAAAAHASACANPVGATGSEGECSE